MVIMFISCTGQSERTTRRGQLSDPQSVYTDTSTNRIVYFSDDNGTTWKDKSHGLPDNVSLGIGGLAVSDHSVGIATKEYGIYLYNSQEQVWTPLPTAQEIIKNNLGSLAFFKDQVYIGTQLNGVYNTSDNGHHWQNVKEGLENLSIRKLVPLGNRLYAGTNAGLYLLADQGKSWQLVVGSPSLQVNGITEFEGHIYLGTNQGIYTNANSKREWKKILDGYSIHNIRSDDECIYAMTYNELLSSTDHGNTWKSIQQGLPAALYTFDMIKKDHLLFAAQWDGVYRKSSEQDHWKHYSNGLPGNLAITNIKSNNTVIIASGNERGLRQGMTTNK